MNNRDQKPGKFAHRVFDALLLIGFSGFVLWLIKRVVDGKAIDLYKSHWGLTNSALGVLIFIGVAILAGIVAIYINHKHSKEEKDLIDKYGKKDSE